MRKWRVGTISMGLSLVLLGSLLMASQFNGWDVMQLALSWWPAILIVLGVEVLLFLFFSKQEKPIIQYDFLSIVFIGILGTMGIGFYIGTSLGVVEEVKASIQAERVESALPHVEERLDESVETIVIQSAHHDLHVETNNERRVHLFGTYESDFLKKGALSEEDVVDFTKTGDTLFIQLMNPPRQEGLHYSSTRYNQTLSLPESVDVEFREGMGELHLNVGTIQGDWMIDEARHVVLQVDPETDLTVKAEGRDERFGWDIEWDQTNTIQGEQEHQKYYYKEKQFSEGTHTLQINLLRDFTIKDVGSRS